MQAPPHNMWSFHTHAPSFKRMERVHQAVSIFIRILSPGFEFCAFVAVWRHSE